METEFNKRAESVYYVKFLTESLFYFAFSKLSRNIGVCSFRLCVIETRVWLYFMHLLDVRHDHTVCTIEEKGCGSKCIDE